MNWTEYGQCGVGAYCLGGCDPLFSHSLDSCVPAPVCKSENYKLSSLKDVQGNDVYLGDGSQANWVSEGMPVAYDDSVLLTMAPNTVGTLLSSTHYVWYGKISTTMTTSQGAGVVTAFIMMSDVKDEIDFEFIGTDVQNVQSNFYWQGALNYTNEKNLSAPNTESQKHTYTFDWSPDRIEWSVDGDVLRTVTKDSTYNSSDGSYHYPQTPARIELSLWPAGESKNGQGTVEWAGGEINWNSPYMQNGYYKAQVWEVDVECYDPPSGANSTGSKSYVYNDNSAGFNNSIAITNDNGVLASFYATGENMGVDPDKTKNQPSSTKGSTPINTNAQTVPGVSGGGNRGTDSSSNDSGGTAGGSNSGTGAGGGTSGTNGQFIQGNDPSSGSGSKTSDSNSASEGKKKRASAGSGFAVLVALVALIAL